MSLIATIIIALSAFTTEGFAPPSTHHARVKTSLFDGKMNTQIDLDSPKVATNTKLSQGGKAVYCRCWKSDTFPLCDGSHMAHNKETGDNVGPLILSAAASDGGVHVADLVKSDESDITEKTSILNKIKSIFKKKEKTNDGLTAKERLAKMGLSALLSYGWVSNMSYSVTLSLSWYTHSKRVSSKCFVAYFI